MGATASLLDETKTAFIKGEVETELKDFDPYYRKQFSVARFTQVEDELEQNKEKITQLLKQKGAPELGQVLYEECVFYFDETRKWRERYIVVRANYSLECHESLETFVKGGVSRYKLLPTGGTVLTTEEAYMAMVDKCYPGDINLKEEFAPPLTGMPGQFPVYLRLPYRSDWYFCFKQQAKQATFISFLSDCIRHQNQDFLKKKTCEVQAFLKAMQLYRQDRGQYETWEMLIGSDVRAMSNLVMEKLLPSLGKGLLPTLRAKRTERKRVWFATVEEAYLVVQKSLMDGLGALKEECRVSVKQQEVQMHSDMGAILNTKRRLEEEIRAKVSESAEELCSKSIQPYLGSVLEEMMEPISSGFLEGRQLSDNMMEQVCQSVLQGTEEEKLKKALRDMARPNLLSCYQKIISLEDKLQEVQERFGFSNVSGVVHGAQIDLQRLIENAAYTFEQLLYKALEDSQGNPSKAMEKVKHIVLKQYDHDSSTVRKRIFQDALVSITLPFIKKNLDPTSKPDIQGLEQTVDADHSNFIHVENIYENILLKILDKEVSTVVKEAASLHKHNLFTGSSRSSLSSPTVSTPNSPVLNQASTLKSASATPPSPLASNGLSLSHKKPEENREKQEGLQNAESSQKHEGPQGGSPTVAGLPETKEEEVLRSPEDSEGSSDERESLTETSAPSDTAGSGVCCVQSGETESAAGVAVMDDVKQEAGTSHNLPEAPTDGEIVSEEASQKEPVSLDPMTAPNNLPAEEPGSQSAACNEDMRHLNSEVTLDAPPAGEEGEHIDPKPKEEEAESVTCSEANSLHVSVGSESPRSCSPLESMGDVSATSDALEAVSSRRSSEEAAEGGTRCEELAVDMRTEVQEDMQGGVHQEEEEDQMDVQEKASVEQKEEAQEATAMCDNAEAASSPSADSDQNPTAPDPKVRPPDCIKEIRDLVVEVIEVEEPLQHYPKEE